MTHLFFSPKTKHVRLSASVVYPKIRCFAEIGLHSGPLQSILKVKQSYKTVIMKLLEVVNGLSNVESFVVV